MIRKPKSVSVREPWNSDRSMIGSLEALQYIGLDAMSYQQSRGIATWGIKNLQSVGIRTANAESLTLPMSVLRLSTQRDKVSERPRAEREAVEWCRHRNRWTRSRPRTLPSAPRDGSAFLPADWDSPMQSIGQAFPEDPTPGYPYFHGDLERSPLTGIVMITYGCKPRVT
jgi:hypothetical protein